MYLENQSPSRESWKYSYQGSALLKSAKNLLKEFKTAEMAARTKMSQYLLDPNISQSDDRIREAKKEIEKNGREAEACAVHVHEFTRVPGKEFLLSMSDVVYFRLHERT